MKQLDLFRPPPDIPGKTNGSGRDVWYDPRRGVWTVDSAELFLSDDEIKAKRAKELADFDAVFGPDEAWR